MSQLDKVAVLGFVTLVISGGPPLILQNLELAIYGFSCVVAGMLSMGAACAIDNRS